MNKTLKIALISGASLILLSAISIFVLIPLLKYISPNDVSVDGGLTPEETPGSYGKVTDSVDQSGERDSTQKVIRVGSISIAVDDIDGTVENIDTILAKYEGETLSMQDSGKGKERGVVLSLRVEETDFDAFYQELKDLDGEYEYSNISSNDVTETVLDMEARLKNLKSVETQYLSILKKATTVSDTLAVQRELTTVRSEIEYLESSLDNMERQTDYSTVYLTITQSSTGSSLTDEEWRPAGILKDASRALVDFAKFLGTAFIWVLVFSPVVAAVVIPVVIIQKKAKK